MLFSLALSTALLPLSPQLPLDNHAGRWMNYATGPITPLVETPDGVHVLQIHQPGSRLVVHDAMTGERLAEVPTGPGLVSLALHPTRNEVWCVDAVTSSVSVVDLAGPSLVHTIPVGAEPHGIQFLPDGSRAYVTCSGADRVDVIDGASYQPMASLPVPVRTPRAIVLAADHLWVLPFRSGNGTAPRGFASDTDAIRDVRHVGEDFPHLTPLPDLDAVPIRIDAVPSSDDVLTNRSRRSLGTMLFNAHRRPATDEVWVPHTEALNTIRGEANFVDGQVVRNRIAVFDASDDASEPWWIDLDELIPDPDLRCAEPTGIAFGDHGQRAFVFGYGSDSVVVLDLSGEEPVWEGTIRIRPVGAYPNGAGPRTGLLSLDGGRLYVHNKAENSTTWIKLAQLPEDGPYLYEAPRAVKIGYNPTPNVILQGRVDFIRTWHSGSKTSSCNSCHVDGHTDGLAWDLGVFLDPEETPADKLRYPVEDKGPMVTQTLRRIKEVGPYHWRGEKKSLSDFGGAFVNLLERTVDGQPQDLGSHFAYVVQYMEHLAFLPNPRQSVDRGLRAEELAGLDLFQTKPVQDGLTCADCHPLPLGTTGEIVAHGLGSAARTIVVPSLRGLEDKLAPPFTIGGDFGTRTTLGAGLMHGGGVPSLIDHALQVLPDGQPRFDLTPLEAQQIEAFLLAFDTGLAPSTAYQITLDGTPAAEEQAEFLLNQAREGHCDVVFRFGPVQWREQKLWVSGRYDPATESFERGSVDLDPFSLAHLQAISLGNTPVTLLGVPLLMGEQMGLDRDLDGLRDLDELLAGTDSEVHDTDEDGLPDGYEVFWGTDPLGPGSVTDDQTAPVATRLEVVQANTHSVKVELSTDEPVRILVAHEDQTIFLRLPLQSIVHDREYSFVVNELEAGILTTLHLSLVDPSGNQTDLTLPIATRPPVLPDPIHVEDLEPFLFKVGPDHRFRITVRLEHGNGTAPVPGYQVLGALYHLGPLGVTLVGLTPPSLVSTIEGLAVHEFQVPESLPAGELRFVVLDVFEPQGAARYVEGDNLMLSVGASW